MEEDGKRPLKEIAEAFSVLADNVKNGQDSGVDIAIFARACDLISILFSSLGIAFKFAEKDYVSKVVWGSVQEVIGFVAPKAAKKDVILTGGPRSGTLIYLSEVKDLLDASKEFDNIAAMVDSDIQADKVKQGGSHTRNLLRVKRGIDMVRLLFQHVLTTEGNSLKEPATKAYDQVFAPYHSWPIRKAVAAGMYVIPTKSAYLAKLNEKESSAKQYVQIFVTSAEPVVQYVDDLFTAKDIGVDW